MKIEEFGYILGIIADQIKVDIPLQQLRLLMLVAAHQGITQTEISERLRLHQATVSRNVIKMGSALVKQEDGSYQEVGWGLLKTRQDTRFDPRRLAVFLTDSGENVIRNITKELRKYRRCDGETS